MTASIRVLEITHETAIIRVCSLDLMIFFLTVTAGVIPFLSSSAIRQKLMIGFGLISVLCLSSCLSTTGTKSISVTASPAVSQEQRDFIHGDATANEAMVSPKFRNPIRFFNQSIKTLSQSLGGQITFYGSSLGAKGNFTVEDHHSILYLEATNGDLRVSYIELRIKSLGVCSPMESIDLSQEILKQGGIDSLIYIRANPATGYTTYQTIEGIIVKTFCSYEGDHYTIGIAAND